MNQRTSTGGRKSLLALSNYLVLDTKCWADHRVANIPVDPYLPNRGATGGPVKGSILLWVANWARRFSALCLLAAGVGALLRQPELNLFNNADDTAGLIRLLGASIAIGTGVVSLTTWRKGAEVAPFVFLNFLFAATIFDVVVKDTLFVKVLVGVLLAAITLEQVCRSWGSAARLPAEPGTDGRK